MFTDILTFGPNDILTSHFHRILSAQSKGNCCSSKWNQAITAKKLFLPHDRWSTGQLVITVSTNREFPQQIRELDTTYFRLTLSYFIFKNWERILKTVRTCLQVCKFCVPCCHLFCIYCETCILTGKNADITKLLGDRALIWE